jgi:hypothetical protein
LLKLRQKSTNCSNRRMRMGTVGGMMRLHFLKRDGIIA